MMHENLLRILAIDSQDNIVGRYRSPMRPMAGELLDTNTGTWIVTQVQHDIIGSLTDETAWVDSPVQAIVVAYVRKLASDQKAENTEKPGFTTE